MDNPQGEADYVSRPTKKRDDYPEMSTKHYLDADTRLAVAKYMCRSRVRYKDLRQERGLAALLSLGCK